MAATANAIRVNLQAEAIDTALNTIGPVNGVSVVKTGASAIIIYW